MKPLAKTASVPQQKTPAKAEQPHMLRKVLVVSKQNKYGLEKSRELIKELEKQRIDIFVDPSTAKKLARKGIHIRKFDGDVVITVGGDGTLLRAASQTSLPILPVRVEGYGFLCTIDFADLVRNLGKLARKEFVLEERLRLKCARITYGIEKYMSRIWTKDYPHSLNEIVFTRKRPSKIMEVEFTIDSKKFNFVGDGLLISTPSGSTAYHASAGGSMIDPSMQAISIAPLYPFFSKLKPMIVPVDKKIGVRVKRGEFALIIDGHGGDYFKPEADFIIEKGQPSKIVNLTGSSFYDRIKDRFLKE